MHRIALTLAATLCAATALAAPLPSLVPLDAATTRLGEADPGARIAFRLAFPLRDRAALDRAFAAGQVLTPAEATRFLPDPAAVARAAAWLRAQGLSVRDPNPARLALDVDGPAALVARVFATHFTRIAREGTEYLSADREPTIPAPLRDLILGINGLQPQWHATPALHMRPLARTAQKVAGSPPYYPGEFVSAYSAQDVGPAGAGAVTAIIIDAFPDPADLQSFWSITGTPQTIDNITFISTVAAPIPPPEGEETLDTQQASSIAPASRVRVYASATLSNARTDQSYEAVIADQLRGIGISQVNMSYAGCEEFLPPAERATEDQDFELMGVLGASVFASSGDAGADACQLRPGTRPFQAYPASSIYVTATGGTSLALNRDGSWSGEAGWAGSGGGVSGTTPKPRWQKTLLYPRRATPDLAADGDPETGAFGVFLGNQYQVGGTSLSAPIWSGLTALINGRRLALGMKPVGPLPPLTTGLAGTPAFHDIIRGSNGKPAHPGFDLVTGVGSPVVSVLAQALDGEK